MKSKIFLILGMLLAALTLSACLLGTGAYRDRFAELGGVFYLKLSPRLDLSGKPLESIEPLRQFPQLEQLDLRGSEVTAEQYETLKSWYPHCEILWDVPFQGAFIRKIPGS